jgi:hypothetical protein
MDTIKGILQEELNYALELQERYKAVLNEFPKGSLSVKRIKGRDYTYLQHREGRKVISRILSAQEVESHKEEIRRREKYRRLLKETEDKIKFIGKALSERKKKKDV